MTDAKLIEPSTERVANTVALLLRFSDDYKHVRDERGAEIPLTHMLDQLSDEDKKQLYKKACETIAEMDEAMKETPSLRESATQFLKTHSFQDIANSALNAATQARQAANRGMADVKKAASEGMDNLNKLANSEEVTAAKENLKENLVKGKDAAKEGLSRLSSFGTSILNQAKESVTKKGGKRKNKTKKLTKKEKKMKRARK